LFFFYQFFILLFRTCLRDLKDKEHLLLPCFLADHDNSNTIGSGTIPISTDESQLSQQIDIPTPLIMPTIIPQRSSPACIPSIRSTNIDRSEPIFVPITNNINHDNQSDSPVLISKRMSSTSTGLTEKQKEKLRTRHVIPLLCDDNSNTQSLSYTLDTPTIESMMATYQLRSVSAGNKQSTSTTNENNVSLLKQPTAVQSAQENNTTVDSTSSSSPPPPPPPSLSSSSTDPENENSCIQIPSNNTEDDIPEESSISKKLRRSRRPSTSARKSLMNNSKKKRIIPSSNELTTTIPSIVIDPPATNIEITPARPLKSILKRLSPTKPRQDHTRHVAFHDQVKVLLFASPARRDINSQQQKKKTFNKDDIKPTSSIATRRSSALHNNDVSNSLNLSDNSTAEVIQMKISYLI
jgi:hypothetical protein